MGINILRLYKWYYFNIISMAKIHIFHLYNILFKKNFCNYIPVGTEPLPRRPSLVFHRTFIARRDRGCRLFRYLRLRNAHLRLLTGDLYEVEKMCAWSHVKVSRRDTLSITPHWSVGTTWKTRNPTRGAVDVCNDTVVYSPRKWHSCNNANRQD